MPAIFKVKRNSMFILPKDTNRSMLSVAHTTCRCAVHKPVSALLVLISSGVSEGKKSMFI